MQTFTLILADTYGSLSQSVSAVAPKFIATVIAIVVGLLAARAAKAILHQVLTGLQFRAAAILAVAAISQIIIGLVLEDGALNLIVRDIGILGLAVGLALDQPRFWQLDSVRPNSRRWNLLWWVWRIGIRATAMSAVALLVVLLWSV